MTRELCSLTVEPLDAGQVARLLENAAAGALVIFEGVTRDHHAGRAVLKLEYEAHEQLALKLLEHLRIDALDRFKLSGAAIHHRLGQVAIGERSVVIAVSAAHRAAAFEGCRYVIDQLKTTVPIWKKEFYADGSVPEWVGPDGRVVTL